jgi:hypothetical protein
MAAYVHLLADGNPVASQPAALETDPAEIAWQNLQMQLPRRPPSRLQLKAAAAAAAATSNAPDARGAREKRLHGDQLAQPARQRPAQTDWQAIAQESREFITHHPDSKYLNEARKLELTAELSRIRGKGLIPPDVRAKMNAYLADSSVPSSERYDISALAKESDEAFAKARTPGDSTSVRIRHARELIREFPSDTRGYGYMLAVAKNCPTPEAIATALELLASQAPENYKQGASGLLAQRRMEQKPLDISGLEPDKHKGKILVIYTWSSKRPEYIALFKRWAAIDGVALIGINTDTDINAAKRFADSQSVPGTLLYDGNGMEGPLASQLHVQMQTSVYIVNAGGIRLDTRGHIDSMGKLTGLAAALAPPLPKRSAAADAGAVRGGGL